MVQDTKKEQIETYEIENKKYKVITRYIENSENIEKIYDVLSDIIISKLNQEEGGL